MEIAVRLQLRILLAILSLPTLHASSGQKLCDANQVLCVTGICPISECIQCEDTTICETSNPNEVVPPGLYNKVRYLTITYTGPDAELTPDAFDYLFTLKNIVISGNIASVAPNTFVKQWNLKWLTISGGKLSSLPDQLFNSSQSLLHLNLPKNRFQKIPTNIFPQIPNIERMDFSYNPLDSCKNSTIEPKLANMTKLEELRLSGYGTSVELCQTISKDYLLPLQRIRVLDLSESLLFFGDQRILSTLTNLENLAVDNVSPYKECPAKAEELFHNMPPKLSNLTFRNWASTLYANESCVVTNTTLTGLKNLEKLSLFDCRFGDKMFGNVLTASIFTGFSKIKTILLHNCGIGLIESGAFNALPKVSDIELAGNLLGMRELQLYTSNVPSKLSTLNLIDVRMHTADYSAMNLLLFFPNLKTLYMDDNHLGEIPDFGFHHNVTSNVSRLTLDNNGITHFSQDDGRRLCKVMPFLSKFNAEKNQLADITGFSVCPSIEHVELASNLVGNNQQANFKALGQLHRLNYLDLSSNNIQYLSAEFLTNFSFLKTLMLADNKITTLADTVFQTTPLLGNLDLSANSLTTFNTSIISNGLTQLYGLYLQSNQITTLSKELLYVFDTRLTNLHYLGLIGNPLTCTCDNYLSDWVRNSTYIIQVKNLTCSTPANSDVTTQVLNFKPDHFLCYVKTPLIISGTVLAFVVLSLLLALPGYKYRWYLRHPKVVARAVAEKLNEVEFDEKCQYDAFISYDTSSNSASQWIVDKLIPAIETISEGESPTRSQLKLYVVDRDSAVGSVDYTEKCRAIEESRKVIILLSNSYLANPACLSEADLVAVYQMVDGEHCYQPNRILVLILEELNEQAIRSPVTSLLTQNVIHIVDDEVKMKRIWRRVRRFITKPKYIYRKKTKTLTTPQPAVEREQTETDPLIL